MVFSLLEYLDSVKLQVQIVCSTLASFSQKNAITFDEKEIERKKKISRWHEILLRIQCCHKNVKIARKKSTFFQKYFQQNCHLKKNPIFRKHKVYFQILEVLPVILTTYLPV